MILDSLSRADSYFTADWWRETLAYIRAATPALPDGVHPVRGETIVARVHTGQTRTPENAVLESHRTYVDVHVVLQGRETIAVWPATGCASARRTTGNRMSSFTNGRRIRARGWTCRPASLPSSFRRTPT